MRSVERIYGLNGVSGKPFHLCPKCGAYVVAATWAEWASCDGCKYEFETSAYLPSKQTEK
jgi:ribosomal protein L37AE/L43A